MKEGRKPEYPEKTPGDELQKIVTPHSVLNSQVNKFHSSQMYLTPTHLPSTPNVPNDFADGLSVPKNLFHKTIQEKLHTLQETFENNISDQIADLET